MLEPLKLWLKLFAVRTLVVRKFDNAHWRIPRPTNRFPIQCDLYSGLSQGNRNFGLAAQGFDVSSARFRDAKAMELRENFGTYSFKGLIGPQTFVKDLQLIVRGVFLDLAIDMAFQQLVNCQILPAGLHFQEALFD